MKKILLILVIGMFLLNFVSAFDWSSTVAYYKMDETTGVVVDETANQINGSNHGAARGETGIINYAFDFESTESDWVNISADTALNPNEITISAWIKPESCPTEGEIIGKWSTNKYAVGLTDSNCTPFAKFITAGGENTIKAPFNISTSAWTHIVATWNATTGGVIYINGTSADTDNTNSGNLVSSTAKTIIGALTEAPLLEFDGLIDEVSIFNRSLFDTEVTELYNSHSGLVYGSSGSPTFELSSPENNSVLSDVGANFTVIGINVSSFNYNWTNVTYYIWWDNGTLFNQTPVDFSDADTLNQTQYIDNFTLGSLLWNAYACYGNAIFDNCTWASNGNFSFEVGVSIQNISYNNHTWETANETFSASFDILEDAEISLIQLVYNGTNYTISNYVQNGTSLVITKTIDIPLNDNASANQTNEFFFRFIYGGDVVQETAGYEQNSSFINLVQCGGSYTIQALNFTMVDEINQTVINTTAYPLTMQNTFNYWVGGGSVWKNYSYQQLAGTNYSFQFCIYPWNQNYTFRTDMDNIFHATSYSENHYYLRNSTLTNVSSDILLYLIPTDLSTKFYITVQEGVSAFTDATVTILKYFVGEGVNKTAGIKETDSEGEFVAYLDIDKEYNFVVVRDGTLYATISKQASCASSPCELTLQIDGEQGNIWEGYSDYFSDNIFSNISYDPDTQIVTYTFIDITGLASYFRLVVYASVFNTTEGSPVCDEYSYSSSGTLTCNITGYSGDFIAKSYISRSPEKLDQVFGFVISSVVNSLDIYGGLLCLAIIITVVFAIGAVSRGNPAAIMLGFGLAVLGLKLMAILPLSWITVSVIELGVLFITKLTKT